jgi:hypothetical protein
MFVFSNWDKICSELSSNFRCIRADEILEQDDDTKWMVVKHDVETNVAKALQLAKIEKRHGICATYYVQADLLKNNHRYLQDISSLGHEVTYHYDVLDAHNGDYIAAINSFKRVIEEFKKFGFEVKTVCPHGNPIKIRNGWSSNKDFFRNKEVNELFPNILDIVVQLPKKLETDYIYISDAGYSWKKIVNVQDNDKKNDGDIDLGDSLNFLNSLKKEQSIILSTHPHRWESSKIKFILKLSIFKVVRYIARKVSSVKFLKKIMSKYYYLAKKI